jgi:hypothetical protein
MVSQVLSYNYSTLIVLLYHQILHNTLHGVHSLSNHDALISRVTSCTHPVQSIQVIITFHRANDCFSLEVLDFRT